MIFFSELNLQLIIYAKLARLSGRSLGLRKIRRTLAPLPPPKLDSDELVDDNLLLKDVLVCHIEATYRGLILTRENLMNFICRLLLFI